MDRILLIFLIHTTSSAQITDFRKQKGSSAFRGTVSFSPVSTLRFLLKERTGLQFDPDYGESTSTMTLTSWWILESSWKHWRRYPVPKTMIFCTNADCLLRSLGTWYWEKGWSYIRNVHGFLQGLPERVMIEIFSRYDIDLGEEDGLDFGVLLGKVLLFVKGSVWRISWDWPGQQVYRPSKKKSPPPSILLSLSHIEKG